MAFSPHESGNIVYLNKLPEGTRIPPLDDLSNEDIEDRILLDRLSEWRDSVRTGITGKRNAIVKFMIREWMLGINGRPLLFDTDLQASIALRLHRFDSEAEKRGTKVFSKESSDDWGYPGSIVLCKTPRGWTASEKDSNGVCCKEAVIEVPGITELSLGDMSNISLRNPRGLLIERHRGFPATTMMVFDDLARRVLG